MEDVEDWNLCYYEATRRAEEKCGGKCGGAGIHGEERGDYTDGQLSRLLHNIKCPKCGYWAHCHRGHVEATFSSVACPFTVTDLLALHEDEENWRMQG